jgi:transcriptional regulator with XRE-family HTH domain
MTPAQCRAASGLLDWTQGKLAEVAGLSLSTVVKLERSGRAVAVGAFPTIKRTLESAGSNSFRRTVAAKV